MVSDGFVWHEVSDKEKDEIQKNAKKIMKDFGKKLENVKVKEGHFEVGDGLREEGEPWTTEDNFHDIMLLNAPFVEDDCIVAEKGAWKK